MRLEFEIVGEPVGKGRPRATARGGFARMYTPAKTRFAEAHVAKCFSDAVGKFDALDVPVAIDLRFNIGIPKSASKKKRAAMLGKPCVKKPDLDNIAKLIMDSLNGLCYHDDSQIWRVTMEKRWSESPGTIVRLFTEDDG